MHQLRFTTEGISIDFSLALAVLACQKMLTLPTAQALALPDR